MTLLKDLLDLQTKANEIFESHKKELLSIQEEVTDEWEGVDLNAYDTLTNILSLSDALVEIYNKEHGLDIEYYDDTNEQHKRAYRASAL